MVPLETRSSGMSSVEIDADPFADARDTAKQHFDGGAHGRRARLRGETNVHDVGLAALYDAFDHRLSSRSSYVEQDLIAEEEAQDSY